MKNRKLSLDLALLLIALTAVAAIAADRLVLRAQSGPAIASLTEAMRLVNGRFVGEYEENEVVDAALNGMVEGLNDRWSYYLTEEQYQQQQERRSNHYVGIGVTVSLEREEGLLILEVIPGGPAEEAGLKAGDIITAAGEQSLVGEARAQYLEAIGGAEGTPVQLKLLREDGSTDSVEVIRRNLETIPVRSQLREDGIGYVQLTNFYHNSAEHFKQAVADLQQQGARALIFDVRSNGGGFVNELTDMLDALLPEGPIFISRSRSGAEEVTMSDAECVELPMAVLVNGDTYSAAEFFAAELQEQGAAKIVGEPTSGKGYSQQTYALPHGGAIGLSTGCYFTGSGVSLIGTGLTLDREVYRTGSGDAQLEAAVELLGEP